jgi:serpin B
MNRKSIVIGVILLIAAAGSFLYVLIKQPDQTPIISQVNKTYDSVLEANNQFAVDLYQKYRSNDGNIFFSPFSISSALAMTYEGAKGQTAGEMQKVLHFPGDIGVLRSGYSEIYERLNKASKPYKLSTANALWAQKDYPFAGEYLSTVEKYYYGKVTNLDFAKDAENSRQTINNWVEAKTYDRIKELIPVGLLTPATRMVLTNAIYFNASWLSQFETLATNDQDFKSDTKSVSVKMMHQKAGYNYGETDKLQILEMPYEGEDISMLIILPKGDNLEGLERTLSTKNLADWKKNMKGELVELSLPKFEYENKYYMAADLKEMGMPTAFIYPAADFSGISPTKELYIGEVIHQTFVGVSESGTEAAAATAVVMRELGASPGIHIPQIPKIFKADHPFIFIIQERESGNILFMGRVTDPSK